MVQIEGKYAHYKSENLDEFFKATGVPYIARKMMCATSPTLQFKKSGDEWTLSTSTTLRTTTYTFKLGEPYEESMPGNVLKCVASIQDDKLIIESVASNGAKTIRTYEFSDDGLILRLKNESAEAARYYKRV